MQQVPPLSPSRKPATDDLPIDEIRNLSIGDEAARGRSFDGNADRNRDPSPPKIGKSSGKYNSVASFAPPAAYWPDFPFPSRGSPRLVFFDLETTGFAPTARVIQFGAITVDALTMEIIDRPVTWFVHVSESLAPKITEITGITDAHLKGQPAFADRAEAIHKYMDGAVWCGYNIAKFDIPRLEYEFGLLGLPMPRCAGVLDVFAVFASWGLNALTGDLKLDTLSRFYGFGTEIHEASDDALKSFQVLMTVMTSRCIAKLVDPTHPRACGAASVAAPHTLPLVTKPAEQKIAPIPYATIVKSQHPPMPTEIQAPWSGPAPAPAASPPARPASPLSQAVPVVHAATTVADAMLANKNPINIRHSKIAQSSFMDIQTQALASLKIIDASKLASIAAGDRSAPKEPHSWPENAFIGIPAARALFQIALRMNSDRSFPRMPAGTRVIKMAIYGAYQKTDGVARTYVLSPVKNEGIVTHSQDLLIATPITKTFLYARFMWTCLAAIVESAAP